MEDTLRVFEALLHKKTVLSLNPCFNGRYSQSRNGVKSKFLVLGLNPCFNGRYSQSLNNVHTQARVFVLILVLMEDTLRGLVSVVEYAENNSLNPCFNGRYSQSINKKNMKQLNYVLILVLMEDTLRDWRTSTARTM